MYKTGNGTQVVIALSKLNPIAFKIILLLINIIALASSALGWLPQQSAHRFTHE